MSYTMEEVSGTSFYWIGGDHVTSDLAVGIRTTLNEAERVKRENGCVLTELALITQQSRLQRRRTGSNRYPAKM